MTRLGWGNHVLMAGHGVRRGVFERPTAGTAALVWACPSGAPRKTLPGRTALSQVRPCLFASTVADQRTIGQWELLEVFHYRWGFGTIIGVEEPLILGRVGAAKNLGFLSTSATLLPRCLAVALRYCWVRTHQISRTAWRAASDMRAPKPGGSVAISPAGRPKASRALARSEKTSERGESDEQPQVGSSSHQY